MTGICQEGPPALRLYQNQDPFIAKEAVYLVGMTVNPSATCMF